MANSVDPEQTAPIEAVRSGFALFASLLNLSVMLGNYLQQTTSADDIFGCALRVKMVLFLDSTHDFKHVALFPQMQSAEDKSNH